MGMKIVGRERRKLRIRKRVAGTTERPRMSVFRSARHIYAQVIDDTTGATLATRLMWMTRSLSFSSSICSIAILSSELEPGFASRFG